MVALAIFFFRRRGTKQDSRYPTAGTPAAGTGAGATDEKGAPTSDRSPTEPGSEEVGELDGRPVVVTELPTRLPSRRIPPAGRNGPLFRRSDQAWVVSPTDGSSNGGGELVSPVEPHGDAVFELEGDMTPTSMVEARR